MPLRVTKTIFRGGTVEFQSTFYDVNGVVQQPVAAFVNINFPNLDGSRATELIQMTPPLVGVVYWTADVDTRNMGTGPLNWSIHSMGPPPAAVDDGSFQLIANSANLADFS